MAWSPLEVTCPDCAGSVWTELDAGLRTDGATDTLWGRPVHCSRCAYEFEVLFYPQGE